MKIAFIYPGQGAQYAGMGKEIYEKYEEAKEIFERADEALGFNISKLCFEGPEEELMKTENTQPAILTVSVALTRVLQKRGVKPDVTAGLSLGEYSSLVLAEALDFEDAVRLVTKRGKYMHSTRSQKETAQKARYNGHSRSGKEVKAGHSSPDVGVPEKAGNASRAIPVGAGKPPAMASAVPPRMEGPPPTARIPAKNFSLKGTTQKPAEEFGVKLWENLKTPPGKGPPLLIVAANNTKEILLKISSKNKVFLPFPKKIF
ncbi:acyl-carrier-protein S-malonyltransferase [Caldanaerobacter subterraneus subsp. pacificus DSM 12653]|uniref:[acyl-carrier-protein] S-malonyltransferase n=1 Tax=Caldanaerobacter subterraneus subsp. pacificus DSM 12653 TaxID=391606 RepID=A0A0F5PLQ1_9THEO|nr:ACP S-malonyltransferase [Caldanaerobacter subterraneus]KKC29577.1 acyl-carrier-protein S-malonyltransferase [Caldanaerobacter subterraneus subsp. pacificus DSM 12653]